MPVSTTVCPQLFALKLTPGPSIVPTVQSTSITFLMNLLIAKKRGVMLTGLAGTGKTQIMKANIKELQMGDEFTSLGINFNSATGTLQLQSVIEAAVEKKAGIVFGPPGTKKLLFFIDDFNMPTPDKYVIVSLSSSLFALLN